MKVYVKLGAVLFLICSVSAGALAFISAATSARIEANDGNHEAAREHLERYLERYPNGRFRAEAERRLTAIE